MGTEVGRGQPDLSEFLAEEQSELPEEGALEAGIRTGLGGCHLVTRRREGNQDLVLKETVKKLNIFIGNIQNLSR